MPAALVASQFATLELPEAEPDVIALDVAATPTDIAEAAIRALGG
jgi:gluconate kinase